MGLSLTISESNVSKADNTSKITATLKISSSASWNYDSRSGYIQIDGTKYSFSHSFSVGTTTLATKSKTVTHDSDGGGSITVKGYYSTGVSLGNLSISKTYKLTQIDRTYTIKFNSNTTDTVSNMPSSQTKTYGKTLTLSSKVPTRTGYTFKEWNTSTKGTGTSYKPGGSYKTNAADTLYAIWTENTYSVKFTLPSGYATFTSNNSTTITVTYKYTQTDGKIPTVKVATGYSFRGFNINGTRYASGASFKTKKGAVATTSVTATSADFERLTAKLTFTGENITTFYMEQGTGTSFKMPNYPGTLSDNTNEFKYWSNGSNKYYAGSSYVFNSNTTLTAYIGKKADEIFRYYIPNTIESSSQGLSLFLSESASISSIYTIPNSIPTDRKEEGTYQFAYWATLSSKKFPGADYNLVIPKILYNSIESGFINNYNQEYSLYKVGWQDSSVESGDGKNFYAVYIDTTKSSIKNSGSNFAYIKETKDTAGSDAQAVQKDYSDFILNSIEDSDIVLHSDKFVAYVKYTLPSEDIKLNISDISIVGSNNLDQISATTTLITIGLESYIFFSGEIDSQATQVETTTISISGIKDTLDKDIDNVFIYIKPPKIIRDISPTGDIISLFNQNDTSKLSSKNELQIEGNLRLYDSNIYIGPDGDELIESATELNKIIRKYETQASSGSTPAEYGALTGYTGNSIGTLVSSANATFDVVSLTWNGNDPTIGSTLSSIDSNGSLTLNKSINLKSGSSINFNSTNVSGYPHIYAGDNAGDYKDVIYYYTGNSDGVTNHYHAFYAGGQPAAYIHANTFQIGTNSNNSNLIVKGNITANNIGQIVNGYLDADKSVPKNTSTELCYVRLDPGTWIIESGFRAPQNTSGLRRGNIATTAGATDIQIQIAPSPESVTQARWTSMAVVPDDGLNHYYHLNVYHTSSSSSLTYPGQTAGGYGNYIRAIRII